MLMLKRKYSSPQIEIITMQAEGVIAGSNRLRINDDNDKVIDNVNYIFSRNLEEPSSTFWVETESDTEF